MPKRKVRRKRQTETVGVTLTQSNSKESESNDFESDLDKIPVKKQSSKSKKREKVAVDIHLKKGKKPYDFEINVANFQKRGATRSDGTRKKLGKFDNAIDYKDVRKLYITEKAEVANTIKEINPNAKVLNLGGNPFGEVQRNALGKEQHLRKSTKRINWRTDKAFSPLGFRYPIVDSKTNVIVISDDDFLGQYWNYHFTRLMKEQTKNVDQLAIETDDPKILEKALNSKSKQYAFDKNKAIAGSFYVESLSEIGGTITSNAVGSGGIFDTFTKEMRGSDSYTKFKAVYFQGATSLNFTYSDLSLLQKIKDEQLNNKQRIKVYLNTEEGLEEFNLTVEPMKPTNNNSYYNAVFFKTDERLVSIKNTDETVLLLVDKLKIESSQSEDLIKRLASQNILSYPRTEYSGISATQKLTSEQLADIWISYHDEFKDKRNEIISGISEIKKNSGEISKSGILVTKKTEFQNETIQQKVVSEIAKANIQAALGAKLIEGKFQLREMDSNDNILNEMESEEKVEIITSNEKTVGDVADIKISEKIGLTDRELYHYLQEKELGTVATRSRIVKKFEDQGFILKYKGEYKLDDRSRILINVLEESEFDSIKLNDDLKHKRDLVEQNPLSYQQQKELVYNDLSKITANLRDKSIHNTAIDKFKSENEQLEQIEEIHNLTIKKEVVEIV